MDDVKRADDRITNLGLCLAILPVLLCIGLVVLFHAYPPPTAVFEPPYLLPILNTLFLALIPLVIAYFLARSYLASGFSNILLIGCALLVFGAGNLVAGWAIDVSGPNSTVTIHNVASLVASILYVMAALALVDRTVERVASRRRTKLLSSYVAILLFVAMLSAATILNITPVFFVPGRGPTPLREVVLTVAVILHALSAFLVLRLYWQRRASFVYWFGLALLLTATGLAAVSMQPAVGSLMGWVGRLSQYLGGVYFLVATVAMVHQAQMTGTPVKKILASFFRESELHYKNLVEAAKVAIVCADSKGRIILWNPAAEAIFGFAHNEAVGSRLDDLVAFDSPLTNLFDVTGPVPGPAKTMETKLRRKDGSELYSEVSVSMSEPEGEKIVTFIVRDVTERKNAEEARRESEERFKVIASSTPDHLLVQDRELRYTFVINPQLGLTEQDMIGNTDYDILSRADADELTRIKRQVLETGNPLHLEMPVLSPEGKQQFFDGSYIPKFTARGEIDGLIGYFKNVTVSKEHELRITRLSKLYAMLSRVNEAIVRTHDEMVLYSDICRIVAEEGAFPLVWIGHVRDGQVIPVVSCGPATDYLKEIKVSVEGALGAGPSGTCIREDHAVINDDFDTNPSTAPWREPALRYEFRASAAFPLHRQGRVVGTLTLYATEPGSFEAEQVRLLEALAADISYALDTMQQEELRTQAESALQHSLRRFELLAQTASQLLQTAEPQKIVNALCHEVMEYLDCHAFFNFLVVDWAKKLRLNAYAGIPEEEARKIEWLDYGVAVCGCAARDCCRIVAEHIPTTPDERTELVKSYGIKAYACHPLLGPGGNVIGTLSFGTRSRETFNEEDLSLMKAVADLVAVAMVRVAGQHALKKAYDELEERVRERTSELQQAYEALQNETEERKQMEQRLRQAQKMEAIGTLAGGIAHDFNNILMPIMINTEMALLDAEEASPMSLYLQLVLQAANRGKDLVKQIITFSRQKEEAKKPVEMATVVKETLKFLRASIPSSIEIRERIDSASGMVLGDATQIQQVLMNLCSNAAHAMRETGGILDVTLAAIDIDAGRSDQCIDLEPGSYFRLSVNDTGQGMDSETLERAFDPFFTTKQPGEGTGLGLAVAHGIVKNHGGAITVYSEKGTGSTFNVFLPLAAGDHASQGALPRPIPTGNESILLIDDEDIQIDSLKPRLEKLGYRVTGRTDAPQALELFRSQPDAFDLVITDQTMPRMRGDDLAKEMLRIRPDIPIILCTGFSETNHEEQARALGIREYIMKPFSSDEIAARIRRALGKI